MDNKLMAEEEILKVIEDEFGMEMSKEFDLAIPDDNIIGIIIC